MESKTKLLGHPIHPILIVFPLGLLGTSVLFDLYTIATRNHAGSAMAFWMIAVGVIGGLIAAVFGLIDWLAIPRRTRAKSVGLWHGLANAGALALFACSWFLRRPAPEFPTPVALTISFVGIGLTLVGGWLGGELVHRLGVGVADDANLDAPSSLATPYDDRSGQFRHRRESPL